MDRVGPMTSRERRAYTLGRRSFERGDIDTALEEFSRLLETRDKLKNLLNKMEGNDKLEEMLEDIIRNTDTRDALSKDLGVDSESE